MRYVHHERCRRTAACLLGWMISLSVWCWCWCCCRGFELPQTAVLSPFVGREGVSVSSVPVPRLSPLRGYGFGLDSASMSFQRRRGTRTRRRRIKEGIGNDTTNNDCTNSSWRRWSTSSPWVDLESFQDNTYDNASYNYDSDPSYNNQHQHQEEEEECDNDGSDWVYDAIVKVHVTHSEPSYLMPWQRTLQNTSTSSGFITRVPGVGLRIVTNAHSVEYASIVRVQRRGEERRWDVVAEAVSNECDLALLRVDDPAFFHVPGQSEPDQHQSQEEQQQDEQQQQQQQQQQQHVYLEFGPLPKLQQEVQVVGYPTGGDSMSITSGIVSRIERQHYAQASTHLLAIQIDAAINAGNSGGPVLNQDLEVVGVAFQTLDHTDNIGYVVPVNVVKHFLEDVRRWMYRRQGDTADTTAMDGDRPGINNNLYVGGFASLGLRFQTLENLALRKSLGLNVETDYQQQQQQQQQKQSDSKPIHAGVMVVRVSPTSNSRSLLLPHDVITAIDNIPVANDGKIPFRHGERVALQCYIQTKFPGENITVSILRPQTYQSSSSSSTTTDSEDDNNGQYDERIATLQTPLLPPEELKLEVPVTHSILPIPAHHYNQPPPYLIVSGLVFTELSVPLLEEWGAWGEYISENISYLLNIEAGGHYVYSNDERIVVLSQVLAHRENLGYDEYSAMHLVDVDGVKVRNLRHLKSLLEDEPQGQQRAGGNNKRGNFVRFGFEPHGTSVVLERARIDEVTEEVCREQSIAKRFYFPRADEDDDEEKKKQQ